eukprot:3056959-Pleurochrysis_carterae.AAC.2
MGADQNGMTNASSSRVSTGKYSLANLQRNDGFFPRLKAQSSKDSLGQSYNQPHTISAIGIAWRPILGITASEWDMALGGVKSNDCNYKC